LHARTRFQNLRFDFSDPRKTLAVLAILQPDARAEARLSAALSPVHDVLPCSSWDHLEGALGEREKEACLVDVDHPDRPSASSRIASLRGRYPDLAIVACVESEEAEGFFGLGGLGVDGVVFSRSRATRIRSAVDAALSTSRAQRVERSLRPRLPRPGPAAVAWAMEHAGEAISVDRLAGALGHTSRSLRDTLQDAGLPSPSRVLLWGRLLVAGARLGDDRRRVEDVAFSLGYATSTSFNRAMKLNTGLTPAAVSRAGGMAAVLDALVERAGTAVPGSNHREEDPEPDRSSSGGSAGQRSRMARVALAAGLLLAAEAGGWGRTDGTPFGRSTAPAVRETGASSVHHPDVAPSGSPMP
jgi:AraC-like DNA-binding protein